MSKREKRSYIREILDVINENTISFAGGLPDEKLFPLVQIQEASLNVLKNSMSLKYSSSKGIKSLREKIAGFYIHKLGFKTSADEILITSGSQQALISLLNLWKRKM